MVVFVVPSATTAGQAFSLGLVDVALEHSNSLKVTRYDDSWFKAQFDRLVATLSVNELLEVLSLLDPTATNTLTLLPTPKQTIKSLIAEPNKAPTPVTQTQLQRMASRGVTASALATIFHPLVTVDTKPAEVSRLLSRHATVYTLDPNACGAPIKLLFNRSAYKHLSQAQLQKIYKPDWVRQPLPSRMDYVTWIPFPPSPNCAYVDAMPINPCAVTPSHADMLDSALNHGWVIDTGKFVNFCLGKRVRYTEYASASASLARKMRWNMPSPNIPYTGDLNVCDIHALCESEPVGVLKRTNKFHLIFHDLPESCVRLYGLTVGDEYHLRESNGMLKGWFLMCLMSSDYVSDANGRMFAVDTAIGSDRALMTMKIKSINAHVWKLPPHLQGWNIGSQCVMMAKGTFKTTLIKHLTQILPDMDLICPPEQTVDSDEPGDASNPTFEQVLLSRWQDFSQHDRDIAALGAMGHISVPDNFKEILQSFREMYAATVREWYVNEGPKRYFNGMVCGFVHADAEVLQANLEVRLTKCSVNFNPDKNICARTGRVGGIIFQLLLSRMYEMMDSPAPKFPFGQWLKASFGPWLDAALNKTPITRVHIGINFPNAPGLWNFAPMPRRVIWIICHAMGPIDMDALNSVLSTRRLDVTLQPSPNPIISGLPLLHIETVVPLLRHMLPANLLVPIASVPRFHPRPDAFTSAEAYTIRAGLEAWTDDTVWQP
ncbi:VP5 [Reovirus GCRV104]|nr:VP5 [Reovirus GCRV104]